MRRVDTDERYAGEVPLDLFKGEDFRHQTYLDRTAELVLRGIDFLNVSKTEHLHICTGYILSKARIELESKGFQVTTKRITGETQRFAEMEFVRSLVRLGVGDEATISRMRSFNGLLRWVMEDLPGRERFVKTGWRSWRRLREGGRSVGR
jgi:hypothetical protein